MIGTYFLLNDYTIDQVVMRNCDYVCGLKTGWHKGTEIVQEKEKICDLIVPAGTNPKCYVQIRENYSVFLIMGGTSYPDGTCSLLLDYGARSESIEPKEIRAVYIERGNKLVCIAKMNEEGVLCLL